MTNFDIQLDNIIVPKRKRKLDNKKVAGLAQSIYEVGLLNPITVYQQNGSYVLCAGWHRLEAVRGLQNETIAANVVNELDAELVEIDENLIRNELTVLEQGEHLQRRNEILQEKGLRAKQGDNQYGSETVSLPLETTEDIAEQAGLSKRSAQQRVQISRDITPEVKEAIRDTELANSTTQLLELARLPEEQQKEVAGLVLGGLAGNVSQAMRKVRRQEKLETISQNNKPLNGNGKRYSVIYADPPWQYDFSMSGSRQIENQYPTMELEDICNLKVQDISGGDAVLFLWATSPKLIEAFQVVDRWGFTYITCMVWDKQKIGMGYYARQKHELLLIAKKGNLPAPEPATRPDSIISYPRQQHSQKPEVFYEIIEAMYPGLQKIELFARDQREGWDAWGNQV